MCAAIDRCIIEMNVNLMIFMNGDNNLSKLMFIYVQNEWQGIYLVNAGNMLF